MWKENLESKFKDRALGIARDEEGWECLEIDGHLSDTVRGLGVASGIGKPGEVAFSKEFGYMDGPKGAYDPDERIKQLDIDGLDAAVLYPTIGLLWEEEVKDPELALAYNRVYNDWIADYCSHHPDRLYGAAHISLMDVEGGIAELKRAAKLGLKSVMLTPYPTNGKAYGDTYFDPFWAEAEDMGMPVGLHVVARPGFHGSQWYDHTTFPRFPLLLPVSDLRF